MAKSERLTKANIKEVIKLLEQDKPITKKVACEMLGIGYNTSRLNRIIEEFKDKEARAKKMRAKLRGTPLTDYEYNFIASEYLNETPLAEISERTFRSLSVIKRAIEHLNMPEKHANANYANPYVIEEEAIAEEYEINDLVYAARYQCAALIDKKYYSENGAYYRIYLLGDFQQYATQPYWELANLTKAQRKYNLRVSPTEGVKPSNLPR